MTTHYEFLAQLHALLQPRGYLEIGVQNGHSLALAQCPAIGVDPAPLRAAAPNEQIFAMTSDDFFATHPLLPPIDLVYIDGMHLFEYALRDFLGAVRHSNERTVIVFDDVLPYNAAIAAREQPAGDWAGDVWKMIHIMDEYVACQELLVDVTPTGALVVWDWDPMDIEYLRENYDEVMARFMDREIPAWILEKQTAEKPDVVLRELSYRRNL